MPATELPWIFTEPLEQAGIDYMVVGAFAAISFGVYRTTNDLDLVLAVSGADARRIELAFPAEFFYCPPIEVLREELNRAADGHFNLIHQLTQWKADCYPIAQDPLQFWGLQNRKQIHSREGQFWVAPPEVVILKKLEFYRQGESPKHIRDIQGILAVMEVDRGFIEMNVERLGLGEQWLVCQPESR